MSLANTRKGFTSQSPAYNPPPVIPPPVIPPPVIKKKGRLRRALDFSKNSKGGRAVTSSAGWIYGKRTTKGFKWIVGIILFIILFYLVYSDSSFFGLNLGSYIFWIILWFLLSLIAYLQFKDGKTKSGLILLAVLFLTIFYKFGVLQGQFDTLLFYYNSWSGLPTWSFIPVILYALLIGYNIKQKKWGIVILLLAIGFILWVFSSYIQDIIVPKIEATAIGGGLSSGLSKIKDMIFNPEKLKESLVERSKFGPKVEEKEPMKGVKVMEFSPIYDNFLPGKPVSLRGRVHIDAIEKPTGVRAAKVSLYCEAEDKGKRIKKGLIRVDGRNDKFVDKSELEVSQSRDYTLWCEFKEGFSVESGKEVSTVTAKLVAVYDDFVTRTDLPISTVISEKENEFLEEIKLEYGSNREAKALCVSGCALTKLSLSTSIQPLVEEVVYNLDVRLLGASDWYGKIVNVESVELIAKPAKATLIKESCDFNEGQIDERITKYNEELKKNKDVNLVFYCDFKVNPDEELETSFFRVDAKYDYAVEARKVINIIKERA